MPTEITPNGAVGRKVDRRQRRKKLIQERDSLVSALNNWTPNPQVNAINDLAGLKAEVQKLRPMIRDCAQALRVLISVQLEEMAEEEAN
jgi:hypothetical protein